MSVIGYNQPGTLWLPSLIIIHFLITLCSRVQWFRHFFINSICFMCFWFGLEILRLVYKKAYFEILNSFYLTWPFILQESTPPLIRVEKMSSILGVQGIKKAEFCADFKNVQKSWVWQKGKLFVNTKFCFFWYPLHPISKKFLFNSYKGRCCFFGR